MSVFSVVILNADVIVYVVHVVLLDSKCKGLKNPDMPDGSADCFLFRIGFLEQVIESGG